MNVSPPDFGLTGVRRLTLGVLPSFSFAPLIQAKTGGQNRSINRGARSLRRLQANRGLYWQRQRP